MIGLEIDKSALIIVDMQNDFVHPEGGFAHIAREAPEAGIDMPFLMGTIPYVQRLADAFRAAGRPVVYLAHMVKPDYSDAQFPYWRIGLHPGGSRPFIVEGTWGAQIIDALQPIEIVVLVLLREARSHVSAAILNRVVLPHQVAIVVRRVTADAATRSAIPVDDLASIHTGVATGAAPSENLGELSS